MTRKKAFPLETLAHAPKGKRFTRSPARKTLLRLKELEPQCLENIRKDVHGEEVSKSAVDTSKWVLKSYLELSKHIVQEEQQFNAVRMKAELSAEDEVEEEVEAPKPRFSLHVLPTNKDV